MHNIKYIRENPSEFDNNLKKRGLKPFSENIIEIDIKRRGLQTEIQKIQNERNSKSKEIGLIKSKNGDVKKLHDEVSILKEKLSNLVEKENQLSTELNKILLNLPNIIDEDLPIGNEDNNLEIRKWGSIKKFNFQPKDHVDIGEKLDGIDFSTAVKLSGSRFVLLKGQLSKLERALASYMLDMHTENFGYTEITPPIVVNEDTMKGTGQLPKFEEDLFKTTDNRWLIPTAEVPLTNIVSNSILTIDKLPLRFTAYTQCFRAEAGAAGRDTRGMIRNHQFSKVELVSICSADQSKEEHERMTNIAESILKNLELPYRVVLLASKDIGFSSKRTYDLEVWLPGQNNGHGAYREISSCSNCGDFQSLRMKARYKENDNIFPLHTLNGSGLAIGRTIIAILENGQQEDGTVLLPKSLRDYMKTDKLEIKYGK